MNENNLPQFNIFCGGTQMTGYTWLSARCLIESCPEVKRNTLRIRIHLIGLNKKEKVNARRVFEKLPYVEIVEDTILPDERKSKFDRFRVDLFGGRCRIFATKIRRRVPQLSPFMTFLAGPDQRVNLGLYHHEWISAICKNAEKDKPIVIVDTDMFVADSELFSDENISLPSSSYAGGWIWRTNNSITYNHQKHYPIGTELFIINPELHRILDKQKNNNDINSYSFLKSEYPDLLIENEKFIDTLFSPCWLAQIKGYEVDTRFRHLKVCHPGGVGHLRLEYLKNIPHEIRDKDNWLRLNIGRVRLHCRMIELIRKLGMGDIITSQFLNRIEGIRDFILADRELAKIWNSDQLLIDGEENMEYVEKLFDQ